MVWLPRALIHWVGLPTFTVIPDPQRFSEQSRRHSAKHKKSRFGQHKKSRLKISRINFHWSTEAGGPYRVPTAPCETT